MECIEVTAEGEGVGRRKWAVLEESVCLGCGVCYSVCKFEAIAMKPRPKRVFTLNWSNKNIRYVLVFQSIPSLFYVRINI